MIRENDCIIMETNIDDCSGEILAYTMDRLLEEGALDVFYSPVFMKKNRPAYLLTVSCREADLERLGEIIFRETTSIGIRYRRMERMVLEREKVTIETDYGKVEAKKVFSGDYSHVYPEYESLKKIARKTGIPLKDLYDCI